MPGRPNNATVVDACTQRLRALASYVDGKATIAINGRKLALAEVRAIFEESLDSRAELARQRAVVKAAMARRAKAEAARREAERALKAWVGNEFGIASKEAIDFGYPPAKKPEISVEAKALAVARRQATREARRTMGRRQKEGIRGTIAVAASLVGAAAGASAASVTNVTSVAAPEEVVPGARSLATGERPWPSINTG
jgi:hypothetical protein